MNDFQVHSEAGLKVNWTWPVTGVTQIFTAKCTLNWETSFDQIVIEWCFTLGNHLCMCVCQQHSTVPCIIILWLLQMSHAIPRFDSFEINLFILWRSSIAVLKFVYNFACT